MKKNNNNQIETIQEALRYSPENLPLRILLAEALHEAGRLDEAEQHYRVCVTRHPKSMRVLIGLSRILYETGRLSESIVTLDGALRFDPENARAHYYLALFSLEEGDQKKAKEHYLRALQLDTAMLDEELGSRLGIKVKKGMIPGEFLNLVSELEDELLDAEIPSESDDGDDSDEFFEQEFNNENGNFEEEFSNSDEEIRNPLIKLSKEAGKDYEKLSAEKPEISFNDVGGMKDLKEEIRMQIIYPFERPEIYKAYGKSVGGGILLYGPPGCGKTYISRATAGECGGRFISVEINDVLDMYIGESERKLHYIFEYARKNTPSVLFFDEIDAIGASRLDFKRSSGRTLITQFLMELDGVEYSNENLLILGATNSPWNLDPAFRRPGRFNRIIFVPPPDINARVEILRIACKSKPVKDIDFRKVASVTKGYSGADLVSLVDRAAGTSLKESLKTSKIINLTTRSILAEVNAYQPSTLEWFATAKNYAVYANEAGIYDAVLDFLKKFKKDW